VSVPVNTLPEARQDIRAGRAYYDHARAGLGRAFVTNVLATLDRIGDMPEMYGEVGPGIRAAVVKRFGYVVYYRLVANGVEVLAVLHGSRDPGERLFQE